MASTCARARSRRRPLTARAVEQHVLPLVDAATYASPSPRLPARPVAEAYDRFAAGGKLGKIVLTMD